MMILNLKLWIEKVLSIFTCHKDLTHILFCFPHQFILISDFLQLLF